MHFIQTLSPFWPSNYRWSLVLVIELKIQKSLTIQLLKPHNQPYDQFIGCFRQRMQHMVVGPLVRVHLFSFLTSSLLSSFSLVSCPSTLHRRHLVFLPPPTSSSSHFLHQHLCMPAQGTPRRQCQWQKQQCHTTLLSQNGALAMGNFGEWWMSTRRPH